MRVRANSSTSMKTAWAACAVVAAAGVGMASWRSRASTAPPAGSREWPTYGHDPGGMRFSPLTQITPANVGQLEVAWVYHMKPAATPHPAAAARQPAAPTRPSATRLRHRPRQGRGRGRGGSGFASSEVTPLVVNGTMYIATPYYRVVALDATTGKEVWAFQLPIRQSVDARRRVLARRRADAAADRLRLERRQAVLARREDREAERGVRRQGHRQPEYAGDPAGPARPQRTELAADRLQEPGDHRRHDAGEPAARAGRRRARVGHAHRQAGVDVPIRFRAPARSTTTRGPATAGRTARA